MRGDSIRDLYAKTLALLGLGLLAGTGALVDYWPSSMSVLPVVGPALTPPDVAWALPEPAPALPEFSMTRAARSAEPQATELVAAVAPLTPSSDLFVSRTVALTEPPPAALARIPVQAFVSSGEEVLFTAPPETADTPVVMVAALSSAPVSLSGNDERDSFFAGASKRIGGIGATIVKGGAKTGASFVDMVRSVNRAVRRVLPD